MEIENNNSIAFLDVFVSKNNCRLTITVYRKPTHTQRYLNYRSNQHPLIKSGIIKYLRNRALNVCSEGNLPSELDRLYNVFRANGYPSSRINNSLKPSKLKRNEDVSTPRCDPLTKTDRKRTLVLPYVRGLSEDIGKAYRHLNIITAFTSKNTLRRSLSWVKTPTPQEDWSHL